MAQRFDSEDDYNPHGEHVVEIPGRDHGLHPAPRRSYATVGVAAFLAVAGIGITAGLISDQSRRAKDEAAQREELRVGWQMLGALAADGAQRGTDANAANAPQPAAAQTAAAPNVVVVNVPAQAGQPQAVPPSGTTNVVVTPGGATQAMPNGTMAAPGAAQAPSMAQAPNMGVIAQPLVAGGVPGASAGQAAANGVTPSAVGATPAGVGATPAVTGAPSVPAGSVAASPPNQSLPVGSVPAASDGVTFPFSQMCGLSTCNTGSVCCNPSCGICTEPGATCSQQTC